jgi:ankyrin repeat protein
VTTSTSQAIPLQPLSFTMVIQPNHQVRANTQFLIETENLSPNIPDPNSYTPMHASASYAHTDILEYLISVGGDINLRDDDGDTPLYVVESLEMARWMIERGAQWGVVNEEGLSVSLCSSLGSCGGWISWAKGRSLMVGWV